MAQFAVRLIFLNNWFKEKPGSQIRLTALCSSRKNPYIPGRGGGGILKAKFLEAIYENKLEFSGG